MTSCLPFTIKMDWRFLRNCEDDYDIIINDATDPFGHTEGLFTKEFGNSYRALKEDGIMIYQHGVPSLTRMSQLAEACTARSIKPFQSVGSIRRISQPDPAGYCLFGFASKNTILSKILTRKAGKTPAFHRILHCKLTTGAFMLPKYVEDILRRGKGKK